MQGMGRTTGKHLGSTDHIRQSVQDILSTPLVSRCMLPEYGSELPDLVDNPDDKTTQIRVIMATAVALARWEPRIQIDAVNAVEISPGRLSLTIAATDVETGLPVSLEGIQI